MNKQMKCFVRNKSGSAGHNNRTQMSNKTREHIDSARTKNNVIFIDKDERKMFCEAFEDACNEYNEKCRKKSYTDRIKTAEEMYEEKVEKNKKSDGSQYMESRYMHETLFQFGNENELPCERLSEYNRQQITAIYQKALEEFQKRNPLVKVTQAILHYDEATPHMHVRWFTVVEKSKGRRLTPELTPAMRAMGYEVEKETKYDNPLQRFSEANQNHFREWLIKCGLVIEEFDRVERDEAGNQIKGGKYTETIQEYKQMKQTEKRINSMLFEAKYEVSNMKHAAESEISDLKRQTEQEMQKTLNEAITIVNELKTQNRRNVTLFNAIHDRLKPFATKIQNALKYLANRTYTKESPELLFKREIAPELEMLWQERFELKETITKTTQTIRRIEPEYEPRGINNEPMEEYEDDEWELC